MSDHALPPYTEAFSQTRDGSGTGLVLAQLDQSARRDGPVLWVQDRLSEHEGGLPYGPGIARLIGDHRPILRVAARDGAEALWAMEEGLECKALSAVIGEVWGNPKALDFTATKRLGLRARRHGVPLWLLRQDGAVDLSIAPDRWRVTPVASGTNTLDPRAPGRARWGAELFRSRRHAPGEWVAEHDRAAHRVDLAAPLRDSAVGTGPSQSPHTAPRAVGGGSPIRRL